MRLGTIRQRLTLAQRIQLGFLKTIALGSLPDMIPLLLSRPELFGLTFSRATEQALRGPSMWTHGQREQIASSVSGANQCPFCATTHGRVARDQLQIEARTQGLDRHRERQLAAALQLAEALTRRPSAVGSDDFKVLHRLGVDADGMLDVVLIVAVFNFANRFVSALGFRVLSNHSLRVGSFVVRNGGYVSGVGVPRSRRGAPEQSHEHVVAELRSSVLQTPVDTVPDLRRPAYVRSEHLTLGEEPSAIQNRQVADFVDQIALHPYRVSDEQVRGLVDADLTEDAVLEITLAAAIGASWAPSDRERWRFASVSQLSQKARHPPT